MKGYRFIVLSSLLAIVLIAGPTCAQAASSAAVDSAVGWSALTCCCCCPLVIVILVAIILIGFVVDLFAPGVSVRPQVVTVHATGSTQESTVPPAQPAPSTGNCKSCGAPVDDSHEYCTQCGTKVKT